jgi:hypothetical protein
MSRRKECREIDEKEEKTEGDMVAPRKAGIQTMKARKI